MVDQTETAKEREIIEGNIITKYWLKRFEWYDWRFLIQLPLFCLYLYFVILLYFLFWVIKGSGLILDKITNIRLMEDMFK